MRFFNDICDYIYNCAKVIWPGEGRAVRLAGCALACGCLAGLAAGAAEIAKVEAQAPPNTVVLEHTRGGAYFVSQPLKMEYDRLLGRVRSLRAELDAGLVSGPEVLRELNELQPKLDRLRAEIEEQKVLVSPLKIHTQADEIVFDLGPERLLVVTGDHVRLEGWDGPGVKCVLEKTVLAPDDTPVDGHLKGMRVVHHRAAAPNVVGASAAEREAEEQAFLTTPEGIALTPPQLKRRAEFHREIAEAYAPYEAFQGKVIDSVGIEGLTFEEGNRQVSVRIESPEGGGASSGSDWQRHAVLTVYVPACEAVAIRGCLGSLDVRGVRGALVLTRDGSRARDYNSTFRVRNLRGSLTVFDVPLDEVADVAGGVTIKSTTELANTGTTHGPEGRTLYIPPARKAALRNIEGDLTAWFTRAELTVEGVGGRIDVRNEFGSTTLAATARLAERAHRVISESGRVEVRISQQVLQRLPLHALTNCGTIHTDAPQNVLEEINFTLGREPGGAGRDWRGLRPTRKAGEFVETFDRVKAILAGEERSPGLDVISRCGIIRLQYAP